MRFGLNDSTIGKINSVFEKYPEVEEVLIYGSRAKGNYRNSSDIDITLKGEKLTAALLSIIETDIDDLLTPYMFDISIFKELNSPDLEDHINRIGVPFYTKEADNKSSIT
jgi:predicted nucleotidyltransferase